MVCKSSIIPGLSKFIDERVLVHYPPTSLKRIIMAGAISLYLQQNQGVVETITNNPLFSGLKITHDNNMIDLDTVRDVLKREINKAGFARLTFPFVGDIDFTPEDVDALHRIITEVNTSTVQAPVTTNGGVY